MVDLSYVKSKIPMATLALVFLSAFSMSQAQSVEFNGYGVRQHIIKSSDNYGEKPIAYEQASVSLVLRDDAVLLKERFSLNDVDTVLFEIGNEVYKDDAFYFDLTDVNDPSRNLAGQFKPRKGEFVIMAYDESLAIVYLNIKRKKTSDEQVLDNKGAWESRRLAQ